MLAATQFDPSRCEITLTRAFNEPPIEDSECGFVNTTIKLNSKSIYAAYLNGVFPWGSDRKGRGRWCKPFQRGVLDLTNYKIDRRDAKQLPALAQKYEITIDQEFERVVTEISSRPRWALVGRKIIDTNWLTEDMRVAWVQAHYDGIAHSFEAWENGRLVAGLYLTFVKGVPTGESIFNLPGYAGARNLLVAVTLQHLKDHGFKFLDIQQNHGLLKSWGAIDVPSDRYVSDYLIPAQARNLPFPTVLRKQ